MTSTDKEINELIRQIKLDKMLQRKRMYEQAKRANKQSKVRGE